MAVWKVQRLGRVSTLTGEPFPPDVEILTALFGDDEEVGEDRVRGTGFVRRDYLLEEATEERLAGSFCRWRTRTAAPVPEEAKRFDLGMAREFLQRLLVEGREDRAPVCLTLALLLARKRRLTIEDQDATTLTCRWPGEKEMFVVPAPLLSEAEAEALQQDIMRLFGFETPGGEPDAGGAPDADSAAGATDPTGATGATGATGDAAPAAPEAGDSDLPA
ncbi:MAG: hypothetical protein O2894_13025, partial [Planctomycetota bacterium]|nr:hypothetical protein [Planctomycetota bacterium]